MAQNALPEEYGQFLTVKDVKERLIQDANPLTLFLWPPNLFAFTSYVLHLSGAYQLVVSPPPGDKDLNHWPPKVALLRQVLGRLPEIAKEGGIDRRELTAIASACDEQLAFAQQRRAEFKTIDEYTPWTFMVRWADRLRGVSETPRTRCG